MLPTMEAQIAAYSAIIDRCVEEGRNEARERFGTSRAIIEKESELITADMLYQAMRRLCLNDLFYLLAYTLGRVDMRKPWLYDRCKEVQEEPDGMLDLWAREHYKSTIITFGKSIQDILIDSNITIGIFSHTKKISRGFLKQIKFELETNKKLQRLFPETLYSNPKKEAPLDGNSWTDEGITVKRTENHKECTVESHGVVDGQPTSKHFKLLIYDDIVTIESVSTPEQILKTTDSLAISYNLGADGGARRFIGTRYHFNDTYKAIISRKTAKQRIHPATDDGKDTGNPVFLPKDKLMEKRRDMGPYVFGCQMLQDPTADSSQGFNVDWLKYYDTEPNLDNLNIYILVDPANSKKKSSDWTVFWVVGLAPDRNYYILDGVRDRLNLTERTRTLFELHSEYYPEGVGYEQYGMQADIQHIEGEMDRLSYNFVITALSDPTPKPDRIKRLIAPFEQGRIWMPRSLWRVNYEGKKYNMISDFVENEYTPFPVCSFDDGLDDLANILHPSMLNVAIFPMARRRKRKVSWEDKLKKKLAEMERNSGSRTGSRKTFMSG